MLLWDGQHCYNVTSMVLVVRVPHLKPTPRAHSQVPTSGSSHRLPRMSRPRAPPPRISCTAERKSTGRGWPAYCRSCRQRCSQSSLEGSTVHPRKTLCASCAPPFHFHQKKTTADDGAPEASRRGFCKHVCYVQRMRGDGLPTIGSKDNC